MYTALCNRQRVRVCYSDEIEIGSPQATKAFAKAVGALDMIICDGSKEQTSKDVTRYVQQIGTTLSVLERKTPWSNRAELYIGLFTQSVRLDMKASDCPLMFWDYCATTLSAELGFYSNSTDGILIIGPFTLKAATFRFSANTIGMSGSTISSPKRSSLFRKRYLDERLALRPAPKMRCLSGFSKRMEILFQNARVGLSLRLRNIVTPKCANAISLIRLCRQDMVQYVYDATTMTTLINLPLSTKLMKTQMNLYRLCLRLMILWT